MDSYDEFMKKYLAKKWAKAVEENNEPLKQAVVEVMIEERRDYDGELLYRKPIEEPFHRQPFRVKDRIPSKWGPSGLKHICRREYPGSSEYSENVKEYGCTECDFTGEFRWKVELHLKTEHNIVCSGRPISKCHGCHMTYDEIFKAKKWDDYTNNSLVEIHHAKCKPIQERIKNATPLRNSTSYIEPFDLLSLEPLDQILIEESNMGFGVMDVYGQFKPIYIDKITAYQSEIMRAIMSHRR